MNARAKPLAELTHDVLQNLVNDVGIVDTIRFLNQFSTGYGNYTRERDQLFRALTLDEMLGAMATESNAKARPNKGAATDRAHGAVRPKKSGARPGRRK